MTDAPLILGMDTSGPYCAAALMRGDDVLMSKVEDMRRGQAERLMGLLGDVLKTQSAEWHALAAIGVCVGPGNFTGIRISVSAARGLGLGLGVPVVGVSLFETTQRLGRWAQTAVPAPRDQWYIHDPDKMRAPIQSTVLPDMPITLSTEHSVADHVSMIARIAGERVRTGADIPAPKPLYIKPPDAAPARDAAPTILS